MFLDNASHRSDTDLKPLCRYVGKYLYHHRQAVVSVKTFAVKDFSQGTARKFHYNGKPSLVTIQLSKGLPYPYSSLYRKRAGPFIAHGWDEEFVFVLAHEMRHIDQFWSVLGHHPHIEVDAEKFAIQVAAAYRTDKLIRLGLHPRMKKEVAMGYPSAVGM